MDKTLDIKNLEAATREILTCENDVGLMYQLVHEIYHIFCKYTSIDAYGQLDSDFMLPSGKAISSSSAAHCLLEMKRTAIFFRGIYQAIQHKIKEKSKSKVLILYAGTGPYATLVTALFPLLVSSEVSVDLLEINPVSLRSATDVITGLGLQAFIGDSYCSDATTFKIEKPYDIVISETMQAALKAEPQVAIMQNLIPQLSSDAVFIPQKITVDAALVAWGQVPAGNVHRMELDTIMMVDKWHLRSEDYQCNLTLPDSFGGCSRVDLFTNIQVYQQHVLDENDCSLNLPFKMIMDVYGMERETLHFEYKQGAQPYILCKAVSCNKYYKAIYIRPREGSLDELNL
nr:hypothetical protein [uncultured Draconibacterium sp.]